MSWNRSQPAWISASTAEMDIRVRAFIRAVYAWMFGGLLLTALASAWVVASPEMQQLVLHNRAVLIGLVVAEFGLVLFLSFRLNAMSPATAAASFMMYSLFNGLTLSSIFFVYSRTSIVQAFVTAAGMYGVMALYGLMTRKNLASWGSFFFMGLMGVLITGFLTLFWHSSALAFTYSFVGVIVFLGLTAYDNNRLRMMATAEGPLRQNLAVIGALVLYLDFVNVFLFLLQLFSDRRR